MATFKIFKLASSIIFVIYITSFCVKTAAEKIDRDAGESCNTTDHEAGACIFVQECEVIEKKINEGRNYNNVLYCNHVSQVDDPVVCCPGKIPTVSERPPVTPGAPGAVIFVDNDKVSFLGVTPTKLELNTDHIIDFKIGGGIGSKAETACTEWRMGAGIRFTQNIYNGEEAVMGEFPHMAAIAYPTTESGISYSFGCGGSLISKNYVLTAAHCRDNGGQSPIMVRLGKLTLTSESDSLNAVDIGIEEFIPHSLYNSSLKYHDIALIRLNETVTFTPVIQPACLYVDTNEIGPAVNLTATGWGLTQNDKQSITLLKANIPYITLQDCNYQYKDISHSVLRRIPDGLIEGQLCAYDAEFNRDTCDGDSGGPLQITRSNSSISTVVGIVSFGLKCGVSTVPGAYTRVSFYIQWIEDIVWP